MDRYDLVVGLNTNEGEGSSDGDGAGGGEVEELHFAGGF